MGSSLTRRFLLSLLSTSLLASVVIRVAFAQDGAFDADTVSLFAVDSGSASVLAGESVDDGHDKLSIRGCCSPRACHFYLQAEAIFYDRENTGGNQTLLQNAGFNPIFTTDNLNFNYQPGVRLLLGVQRGPCCCCDAWEFGYLGIYNWGDSQTITNPPSGVFGAGDLGSGVNGFSPADEVVVDYASKLQSGGWNCVRCCWEDCCRRVESMWGFRYLSLDEDMTLSSNNPAFLDARYDIHVNNDLYGLQAGTRITRKYCRCWNTEFVGKAGVYYVHTDLNQSLIQGIPPGTAIPGFPTATKDDDLAFIGELRYSVVRNLSARWSLRAGYNLLWIEGVATAPDQFVSNGIFASPSPSVKYGGLLAHGFSAGLEARF